MIPLWAAGGRFTGVRTMITPKPLSENKLGAALRIVRFKGGFYYLPVLGSTNDFARALAGDGGEGWTLVVADEQRKGRGRRGRKWLGAPRTGICLSVILRPEKGLGCGGWITPPVAVAVSSAIEDMTGLSPGIKWPNDIIIDGRKVCGILTEGGKDRRRRDYAVVGIGVNVNNEVFPPEIEKEAISLRQCLGRPLEREQLIARISRCLQDVYRQCSLRGDIVGIIEDYRRRSVTLGRQVVVRGASGEFRGKALDIDHDGALIVRLDSGGTRTFHSGEATLSGKK